MAASVLFGMLALVSSCVLAVASTYLVVRWSKKPLLWLLAPLFVFVWLAVAVVPIAGYMMVIRSQAAEQQRAAAQAELEAARAAAAGESTRSVSGADLER